MLVKLARNFFTPRGRFRKGVVEIPDDLCAMLPKSAVILDTVPSVPEAPADDLRSHDLERAAGDAQAVKEREADEYLEEQKRLRENAVAFQAALKADTEEPAKEIKRKGK